MGAVSPTASYLAALDRALPGPGRVRRGLLREVGDHLEDATEAYRRAGYHRAEAERRAVADFGTIDQVLPGFRETVAVASARRTSLMLLGALGIQPFLWDGGLSLGDRAHSSDPDTPLYNLLDSLVEVVGLLGLVGAVVSLGLTAVGRRWLRNGTLAAQVAAWHALVAAVAVPLMGISMVLLTGDPTALLLAMAVLLMVAPLTAAGISARRTLAAC